MYLAWKEIRYAKLRYSLIIGIMLLVAYVVFMLSGLANGLSDGHKKAVSDWGASSIILSEDSNKVASASILTQGDLDRVTAKDKAAVGITASAISHKTIPVKPIFQFLVPSQIVLLYQKSSMDVSIKRTTKSSSLKIY